MAVQKSIFLHGEADQFFKRNEAALSIDQMTATDPLLAELERAKIKPRRVLEIGCANGWRLEYLNSTYGVECSGIDPSSEAVKNAAVRCPQINMKVSTADALPFDDATFDLVLFGFCLYLCDPADLFKIASEANRVLEDGGYMGILDFHTRNPYRNSYSHLDGVWSHKMDFSRLFTWHPAYTLRSQNLYAHDGSTWTADPDDTVAVSIIHKNMGAAFPNRSF